MASESKSKKWAVYKVEPGAASWIERLVKLGSVEAAHEASAFRKAQAVWPTESALSVLPSARKQAVRS